MLRPAARHWFVAALCSLVVNVLGAACLIGWCHANREGLRILSITPEGEAEPPTEVLIAFDRDVVAPDRVGELVEDRLIRFTPRIAGYLSWADPRTLCFELDEALPMATPYAAEVSRQIRALDGHGLVGRNTFKFHTERLKLTTARQVDVADFRPTVCLDFNQAVVPAEVEKRLTLNDARGKSVAFRIDGNKVGSRVHVKATERVEDELRVVLAKGLRGTAGPLGLEGDETRMLDITGSLRIIAVNGAGAGGQRRPYVVVETTQAMPAKGAQDKIAIEPSVEFHAERCYWGDFKLFGDFEYGKEYRLRFSKDLAAENGEKLGRDVEWTIDMPNARPQVDFLSDGVYLSTQGSLRLPIECINTDRVDVRVEKIYVNNIVHYLSERDRYRRPRWLGLDLPETKVRVKSRRNVWTRVPLDLRELLGDQLTGPAMIQVSSTDQEYRSWRHKLILVTNIGLSIRRSDHDLLVWANTIDRACPVVGARVTVLTRTNQTLVEGVTDEEGVAYFSDVDLSGGRRPFLVTAAKGDDLSYVDLAECALSTSDFDVGGHAPLTEGYEAFVYTDRGIYRPGEQVHLNAVVRGRRLALPSVFPVEFEIQRPDERVVRKLPAQLSEYGTATAVFAVHEHAQTGAYTARVRIPGQDDQMGSDTFMVEEFVPDRMKAEIVLPEGELKAGQAADLVVKGAHLLGHPAAGRMASCECDLKPCPFEHPDWSEYSFFDATQNWDTIEVDLGEGALDKKGERVFVLSVPEKAAAPARLRAQIGASVKEIGGRAVSAYEERLIDLYPFYVGASRPRTDPDDKRRVLVDCVAVAPNGRLSQAKSLTCVLEKLTWHTVLKRDEDRRYRYVSVQEVVPVSTFDVSLAGGRGTATFEPRSGGNFRLRVSDPVHGAATSVAFWRSGYGATSWELQRPDRVDVATDRDRYSPGDVARVMIRSPFPGRLAFFAENDGVLLHRVLALDSNAAELEVPITPAFGPTAYFSATVIRPLQKAGDSVAHRALGICPVAVVEPDTRLAVRLDGPAEIRPKTHLRLPFRVSGRTGKGVSAEVAIAAVDVGVCRLVSFGTPDPWAFFNGKRHLAQEMADVYSYVHPEFSGAGIGIASTPSGGGEEGRLLNPISVKRVKPAALWLGKFVTDADGKGIAELTTPDFDGRLRLMAVAAGKEAVGCGEAECVVANPVLVETSLPRFASTSDAFELPVTITNRTGRPGQGAVFVEASGALSVDGSDVDHFQAAADVELTRRFMLRASAAPGEAKVTISVSLNQEHVTKEVELAVRPPAPRCHLSGSGSVRSGRSVIIKLPENLLPHGLQRQLHVSGLPSVELGAALQYVLRYPWGCAEQTTSRAFPLLYARSIAEVVAPERFEKQAVEEYLQAGLDRLLMMQTYRGGFSYWPSGHYDRPWLTAYVGHFLIEAKKAGCEVPRSCMDRLLKRLAQLASSGGGDKATRCYACYVLALAGRPKAQLIDKLARNPDELWPSSRCQLAAARLIAGDRAGARELLGSDLPPKKIRRMRGGPLRSEARDCAIMLSALLDIDPDDPRIPKLVERLNKAAQAGRWYTTQENAFAIFGLGKYAKVLQARPNTFTASVYTCGVLLREITSDKPSTVALAPDTPAELKLRVKGKGRAYYYWSADGIPMDSKVEEADAGLRVRRQYLDRDDKPVEGSRFRQGEVYQVKLSFRANEDLDNVVAVDLLPAGLEIENPRLATRVRDHGPQPLGIYPDRIDIRDDRLIMFTNLGGRKWHEYRYLVRAVTKGDFHLGPVRAECMYDPDVSSVHGAGRCVVYAD